MAETALADFLILDLSHHIAGPYCTKLLADYGAEVIRLEPLRFFPSVTRGLTAYPDRDVSSAPSW